MTVDETTIRRLCDESDKVEHVYEGIRSRYRQNHYAALRAVLVAAQERQIIHPRVLHQMLFNKTGMMQQGIEIDPGAYRQVSVYIQRSDVVGDIHRFPNWTRVPDLMVEWWADVENAERIRLPNGHRPETIWDLHAHFESIHPFIDGNGRVGRLVMWGMQAFAGLDLRLVSLKNVGGYYDELEAWRAENGARLGL